MKPCVFARISLLLAVLVPTSGWGQAPSARAPVDPDKESAFRWLDANSAAMRKISLDIWNAAEISLHEYKSSRVLTAYLESNGFRVEKGVAGMPTAFVASFGSGKPVIGIRVLYDALAGLSQKAEASVSPIMAGAPGHGCGHNLSGGAGVAAAVAVSRVMQTENLKGTLRVYGSPAEESVGAMNYMGPAGVFDDADAILVFHAQDTNYCGYEFSKAVASARFKFKGVAAHASQSPQLGRSALKGVELMDVGVNFMREHVKEDARIHSVITNGGGQPNVVPPEAESWYYIRANRHQDVEEMFDWVSEIAHGAAMMTRTQVEIRVDDDSHEVLPNLPLSAIVDRNLHLVGAPKFTDEEKAAARKMQEGLNGNFEIAFHEDIDPLPVAPPHDAHSDDGGNVSWKVPYVVFTVASYPVGVPIHSWQVAACSGMSIGQKAMEVAAKTLAGSAIDLFKSPAAIAEAKKDLEGRTKGAPFRLLTSPDRKPPVYPESQ